MASQNGMPPLANIQPPYPPQAWALGGPPMKNVDIPAQAVFLVLFVISAAIHMVIFQKNRARGRKFLASVFIFIFCASRVFTSVLRIASVLNPLNIQLAIVAQIFVAAGVLILFIINIIFSMRLVRSLHPGLGWHPAFSVAFKILCTVTGLTLIAVIAGTVQSFYTLDTATRAIDLGLQLYGSTFLALVATLPLPITVLCLAIPYSPPDTFGIGRLRTKVVVLLISTTLLALGAWYRCFCTWAAPVPRTQPLPAYLSKTAFYVVNFAVEIQTVLMYAIFRVDLRWHIPNGARGPGSYSDHAHGDASIMDPRSSTQTSPSMEKRRKPSETLTIDTLLANTPSSTRPLLALQKPQQARLENNPRVPPHPSALGSNPLRASLLQSVFGRSSRNSRSSAFSFVPTPQAFLRSPVQTPKSASISVLNTPAQRTPAQNACSPALNEALDIKEGSAKIIVTHSGEDAEKHAILTEGLPGVQEEDEDDVSVAMSWRESKSDRGSILDTRTMASSRECDDSTWWRASAAAPTIPDPRQSSLWPQEIQWELKSPRRFLSMKRRVTRDLKNVRVGDV